MRRILIISIAIFVLFSGALFAIKNPSINLSSTSGKTLEQSSDTGTFARSISNPYKQSIASAEMNNKTRSFCVPQGNAGLQVDKSKQQPRYQTQSWGVQQQAGQQFEYGQAQQQGQQYNQQRLTAGRQTGERRAEERRTEECRAGEYRTKERRADEHRIQERRGAGQQTLPQNPPREVGQKAPPQDTSREAGQQTLPQDTPREAGQKAPPQNPLKEAPSTPVIDTGSVKSGYVGVKYQRPNNKRCKVLIEKDGQRYAYDLAANGSLEKFPLQMGDGEYRVRIMEHVDGTQYRTIGSKTVEVKTAGKYDVYLASVNMIRWNSSMAAIRTAKQLAASCSGDMDKVKKIYNYVISKIGYDTGKLGKLPSNYVPDIDTTFITRKGICYDFSSLFAGMLRSVGIPAKLVKGYVSGVEGYHAWNEVYIESKGKWIVIDTSYDAQMRAAGGKPSMTKDKSVYSKKKEY